MQDVSAILVAEDNSDDAFLLSRAFFKAKVDAPVRYVRDGQEAIDYLEGKTPYEDRAQHPMPDLLILDLKMPRIDGFEVLRWLAAHPGMHQLNVAVLSGLDSPGDEARANALGARFYIVKPSACGLLASAIERVANESRLHSGAWPPARAAWPARRRAGVRQSSVATG